MNDRPDIVVIICDDLGVGDVGWLAGDPDVTPHLDALAADSRVYTQFHSSGAVCSPTRAALVTGRYQQRCGITGVVSAARHRHVGLPPGTETCAGRLREIGYRTALIGKWHLGYQTTHNPVHFGFDHFRGYVSGNVDYFSKVDQAGHYDWWDGADLIEEDGYVTDLITDHACRFIDDQPTDQPMFLHVAHMAPHYPYQPPDGEAERIAGQPIDNVHGRQDGDASVYRAMVRRMDEGVGRIVEALRRRGTLDRTLLMFTSDHGATAAGSNGSLRGGKASLWQGGIQVPTLARWPGQLAVGRTDERRITMDLTAAAYEAAELDAGALDGISLSRRPGDRPLCWAFREQSAARIGDWKWVDRVRGTDGAQLFNLADDPGETTNRADDRPDLAAQLAQTHRAWRADVGNFDLVG